VKEFTTAPYKSVIAAFGMFYGASETEIASGMRGRVKNFQKLGVPLDTRVGKGTKIEYGRQEIYQLLLCFEMAKLGMMPSEIVKKIEGFWLRVFWPEIENELNQNCGGNGLLMIPGGDKARRYSILNIRAIVSEMEKQLAKIAQAKDGGAK
jgi:hypothetical protein